MYRNLVPALVHGRTVEAALRLLSAILPVLSLGTGGPAAAEQQEPMVLIPAGRVTVGTSKPQRAKLAERFGCHPTWIGDDLPQHDVTLAAFRIDRFPVTNAQYLAFVEATGHARPPWWGRWGGAFPTEYAEHPVVGVSGTDAQAYARWLGKHLPSAEEWEAAIGSPNRDAFAWGDAWPGPLKLQRPQRVFWELPGTRPVGTGGCGRSAAGVEDFAGQALEWVADIVPHHGVQFQALKGASWFHEDPVNFRTASGWYAYEGWRSAFTGFRCALDATESPRRAGESSPSKTLSADEAARQLRTADGTGDPALAAAGGTSRHLAIHVPRFGAESVSLTAPETIIWNGTGVMTWRKTPEMTWTLRSAERATYTMQFADLRVDAEFLAGADSVEQRFTATNATAKPGSFRTSSCFNLQAHPMFYDCEQLRTYVLTAAGEWVPMRRLSRGGDCVRWITGPNADELGEDLKAVLLAVVSRDGRRIIATGRGPGSSGLSVATNTLFTCLHADSAVVVGPNKQATTRQLFWFLEGTLEDLRRRARRDLKMD